MSFWGEKGVELAFVFGSSKQNTHVCIYTQEGGNGVSLNYNRHWTETRISAIFSAIVSFTQLCIMYDSLFLVIFITFPVFCLD